MELDAEGAANSPRRGGGGGELEMASPDMDGGGGGGGGGGQGAAAHQVIQVIASIEEEANAEEIVPLLVEVDEKPKKMTIFSVSYANRRKPSKETMVGSFDAEVASLNKFILWVWSGSRYSGLLSMASSSAIYCIMEALIDIFPVGSIPLYQILFARCTIIFFLSFIWLRRTGQPIFGPAHTRNLLISRALTGCLSLISFIYSVEKLPHSYAILLNFVTPVGASIMARTILKEKLSLADIGGILFYISPQLTVQDIIVLLYFIYLSGLSCSFLGLLFIFQPKLAVQGGLAETSEARKTVVGGSHQIYPVLAGIFSSTTGGISYCLIRAGAKASDQPVLTVLAFSVLACPLSAICMFSFQTFVLPDLYAFSLMIVLGVLAFFAEVSLARGLHLEKTSKVTNIQYIMVLMSQIWGITFFGVAPSSSKLIGFFLILTSVCSTVYLGHERD